MGGCELGVLGGLEFVVCGEEVGGYLCLGGGMFWFLAGVAVVREV